MIAIIGIMAAVAYGSYSEARLQSQAVAMVAQMKEIERAFHTYRIRENSGVWSAWPESSPLDHPHNHINFLINDPNTSMPNLKNYITGERVNFANEPYTYFRPNLAKYVECSSLATNDPGEEVGRGLRIRQIDDDLFKRMDIIIDGEHNRFCGKLKRLGGSQSLYYDMTAN